MIIRILIKYKFDRIIFKLKGLKVYIWYIFDTYMDLRLNKLVESRFGREVNSRGDCELLSVQIELETGHLLSYNTLRRVFGVVNQKVKTRISTLDILAQYVSFKSYLHFENGVKYSNKRNLTTQLYEKLSNGNPNEISNFLIKESSNREFYIESIITTIHFLFNNKDVSTLLHTIDYLDLNQKGFSYYEKLYLGNSIGILFRTTKSSKTKIRELLKSTFFNDFIFEIFVDYSSINGFYAEFICSSYLANSSQKYFKESLRILRNYLNGVDLPHKIDLNDIDNELHPILLGRLLSIGVYSNVENDKIDWSVYQRHYSLPFFYEPIIATILTSTFIYYLYIENEVTKILGTLQHEDLNYYTAFMLMKSVYNFKQGKRTEALRFLKNIDLDQLNLSYKELLSLFYYLLDYKINANQLSKFRAQELSKKLGYSRYDFTFIENY